MLDPIGQLRDMFGIAQAVKSERKQQAAQHTQFVRSLFLGYKEQYDQAPSLAYRLHYQGMMQSIFDHLPQEDQRAVQPILSKTPLDPVEKQRTYFEQNYGPRPELPEEYEKNKYLYAEAKFEQLRYDAHKAHFMTKESKEVPRVLGMPDGAVAFKDEKGNTQILSPEQYAKDQQARFFGMSPSEFIASGGVKRETPYREVVNGVEYEVTPRMDVISRKRLPEDRVKTSAQLRTESAFEAAIQEKLSKRFEWDATQREIITAFAAGDPGKDDAKRSTGQHLMNMFQKFVIDDKKMSPQAFMDYYVAPYYKGYVPLIFGLDKEQDWLPTIWGDGVSWTMAVNDKNPFRIGFVPGVWAKLGDSKENDEAYIYDTVTGALFNSSGKPVPNSEQFIAEHGGVEFLQ